MSQYVDSREFVQMVEAWQEKEENPDTFRGEEVSLVTTNSVCDLKQTQIIEEYKLLAN